MEAKAKSKLARIGHKDGLSSWGIPRRHRWAYKTCSPIRPAPEKAKMDPQNLHYLMSFTEEDADEEPKRKKMKPNDETEKARTWEMRYRSKFRLGHNFRTKQLWDIILDLNNR